MISSAVISSMAPANSAVSHYQSHARSEEIMAVALKAEITAIVAHVLAVVCAVMVLVWNISFRGGLAWESNNKSLIFNIHPVLMLIGFIIIGGEGIISYRTIPLDKEKKKLIHLIMHAIALVLGIVGICAAFKNHNESGLANLYSLHSWFGIGIISLYGIQWIYGFVVFFYPGGSNSVRSDSLPLHVLFGMIVYVLAVANACLGFLEKLTFLEMFGVDQYGTEANLVNFTAIATVLYGLFVFLTVYAPKNHEAHTDYTAISEI